MSSNKKLTVVRTYKSLTRTLSEIGGINSICFLVFYYATVLLTRKTKRDYIVEKVFPFLKQKATNSQVLAALNKVTDSK